MYTRGTSMAIAEAAGVGAGTLYRHFASRDDLVLAVIDDGLLTAAIAWLGDQGRDDAQRSRLLALVLDRMRQASRA
jgi:AcrR family transcriptional regulator